MRGFVIFVIAVGIAAATPWMRPAMKAASEIAFPGWPAEWEERPLQAIALTEREQSFVSGFPGRIAQFTDGRRQIVMRWVSRETRLLHPAADCFRGSGYAVTPAPLRVDSAGSRWGCFEARRNEEDLVVCERILDGAGGSWTDVSSWYWSAAMGKTAGPWWAVTVVEQPL